MDWFAASWPEHRLQRATYFWNTKMLTQRKVSFIRLMIINIFSVCSHVFENWKLHNVHKESILAGKSFLHASPPSFGLECVFTKVKEAGVTFRNDGSGFGLNWKGIQKVSISWVYSCLMDLSASFLSANHLAFTACYVIVRGNCCGFGVGPKWMSMYRVNLCTMTLEMATAGRTFRLLLHVVELG